MKNRTFQARIALLGPAFSYSDLARRFRSSGRRPYFCRTIAQVFQAVFSKKVAAGLVPYRNSISGVIPETKKALKKYRKKIVIMKKFYFSVRHVLVSMVNMKMNEIHEIMSTKPVIAQCKMFLKKYFPKAKIRFSHSSSAACAKLSRSRKKGVAAIASQKAAAYYGLKILKSRGVGNARNKTQFIEFSSL